MKKKIILLTVMAFFGFAMKSSAQSYCSPTFLYGCTSWSNQTIILDSIQWNKGSTQCTTSDYTHLHTTLVKGEPMAMTVVNGSWCGVGVWVDFNSDGAFNDSENLYYEYLAASTQTYNFYITVPLSVAVGTYRMRVIAGWGTDCFTVSTNGYGACGNYQYGNFDDFKVKVTDIYANINEDRNSQANNFSISPNPAIDLINVQTYPGMANTSYTITDQIGNTVLEGKLSSGNSTIDISQLAPGLYFFSDGNDLKKTIKVLKK